MWRAFIEAVGPFLVPFALYALWIAALKRAAPANAAEGEAPRARSHPWIALSVVGLALAFAMLLLTSNRQRMEAGAIYAPAQLRDGQILPGGPVTR
jgi:hypothetical protein